MNTMKRSRLSGATLALAFSWLATAPAWAGVSYRAVTETSGSGHANKIVVSGKAEGSKARIEFAEASGSPMFKPGSFMVTENAGEPLFLCDPGQKICSEMSAKAMTQTIGAAMESMKGMMTMEVTDPKVEKLIDEPGPSMLGIPTRHVRYHTSYTMTLSVMGHTTTTSNDTLQDLWLAGDLGDLGLNLWLKKEPVRTGNAELDKLIDAEMSKVKGFPLKSVTVTTTESQGHKNSSTATTEVQELKTGLAGFSASEFQVPAGYTTQKPFEGQGNPFAKMIEEQQRKKDKGNG